MCSTLSLSALQEHGVSVVHSDYLLDKAHFIVFYLLFVSLPHSLTRVSWDHVPNVLLALKSSCQGLLLREPNQHRH